MSCDAPAEAADHFRPLDLSYRLCDQPGEDLLIDVVEVLEVQTGLPNAVLAELGMQLLVTAEAGHEVPLESPGVKMRGK